MASTIKLLGSEGNLSSASNVGFAKVVRVLNNKTSVQAITWKNAGGTTLGTVTLAAGEEGFLGPFEIDAFNDADGNITITCTVQADIKLSALYL